VAHELLRLATRLYNTPLLIAPKKLDAILGVLGSRIGLPGQPALALPLLPEEDDDQDPADEAGKGYAVTPDGIAVLNVQGSLVRKSTFLNAYSGLTSYDCLSGQFLEAVTDPAVQGILLNIDSPGGEAGGCLDLSDQIYQARGLKPIYAIADEDCLSAAYAIGSAADKLFVTRTGGAGSVGVICLHVDQSAFDQKEGIKYTAIYAGDHKNDLSPHEPLSDEARAAVQSQVDRLYGMFTATVARNRHMPLEDVVATQAACYYGENAVGLRLADQIGTFADALSALRTQLSVREPDDLGLGRNEPDSLDLQSLLSPHLLTAEASATAHSIQGEDTLVSETNLVADLTPATPAEPVASAPVPAVPALPLTPSYSADDAEEILELCALAGKDLAIASRFVSSRMTPEQVRKQLSAQRLQENSANEVLSAVVPATSTNQKPALSLLDVIEERKSKGKNLAETLFPRTNS
jgi:signal peptide peptidase SppA